MHLVQIQKLTWMKRVSKVLASLVLVATVASPLAGLVPQAHGETYVDNTSSFDSSKNAPAKPVTLSDIPEPKPGCDAAHEDCAATLTAPASGTAKAGDLSLECKWQPDSWSICFTNVIYAFTVGLMSIFAYIGGFIFDVSLQLTLNSVTYSQEFITTSWTTVRDFANMAFIFMLVYIALTIIFKADTTNTMRTLAAVIIVALIINFSFLFSRIAIDAGNILAVQFYNAIDAQPLAITAQSTNTSRDLSAWVSPNKSTKDLTANIMQLIGVQTLLSSGSFSKSFHEANGLVTNIIVFSFIYIVVGIILAILAFIFTVVGIKFLVRIVMLWVAIIASPFAFIAGALMYNSSSKGAAGNLFNQWRSMLIEYSFYPAVFLFMFWIVNLFAKQIGNVGDGTGSSILNATFKDIGQFKSADSGTYLVPLGAAVASIAVKLGLLVILLVLAMKASDKVASAGSTYARVATGWAGNKLSGSVAWGGRNTVGWAGSNVAKSTSVRNMAAQSGWRGAVGGALLRTSNTARTATYDARGVAGLKSTLAHGGVKLSDATKMSYKKKFEDRVAKKEEFSKLLIPDKGAVDRATRQLIKDLGPTGEQNLMAAAADLTKTQKEYSEVNNKKNQAAFAAARTKYNSIMDPIKKRAGEITGVKNPQNFANTLVAKPSWNNFFKVGSSYIPGVISKSDQEVAARILAGSGAHESTNMEAWLRSRGITPNATPVANTGTTPQQGTPATNTGAVQQPATRTKTPLATNIAARAVLAQQGALGAGAGTTTQIPTNNTAQVSTPPQGAPAGFVQRPSGLFVPNTLEQANIPPKQSGRASFLPKTPGQTAERLSLVNTKNILNAMPTAPSSTPTTDFISQKNTDDIAGNTRVGEALESLRTTTAEIPKVVTLGADKQVEATKYVGTSLVKELREQAAGSERLAGELRSALKEMHVAGLHHTEEHVGHKLQALTEQLKWTAIPTAGATRASTEVPVQGVVGVNSNPPNITPLTTKKDSSHTPPKPTPQVPRPQDNDRIPPHRDAAD